MGSTTDVNDNMKYLLVIMKHADFTPNYHAVANEAGINNANNAQKRFKKLVESCGFALVGGAVVSADGSGGAPVTPKKSKGKKVGTPASKKRKVADVAEDDQEGEVKPDANGEEVEK